MKKFFLLSLVLVFAGAGCQGTGRFLPEENLIPTPVLETSLTEEESLIQSERPMYDTFLGALPADELENRTAVIHTTKGDITMEFFGETAPMAVSNFLRLAEDGYFDGLTFHRRVDGFVIQGGDPAGDGTGGPGYTFADELTDDYTYDRGIVAMANRGPATNGSQFFIMLADNPLPKAYTIFGRVTSGMDVVDAIVVGDVMSEVETGK